MNDTTPQELLEKAYEEYADALYRHCLFRISDHEKALDLVQDIFFKFWKYLEKEEKVDNSKALLYRIAHTSIIDEYRARNKSTSSLDTMLDAGFDVGDESHEDLIKEMDTKRVSDLIHVLEPQYKDLLVLRYVSGLAPKEIAKATGLSENVISVRLHRGVKKLREIIDVKYGDDVWKN